MKKILKRVAAINDLSGVGKCSLTVIMPILSAMKIEVCPIITAYLSAHTGFDNPVITDMTDTMAQVLCHIESLNVEFDYIFSGYLPSAAQMEIVKKYIIKKKLAGIPILVDPVLGDGGKLYSSFDMDSVVKMRELSLFADVITPNFTEACLLANIPYQKEIDRKKASFLIERLNSMGYIHKTVITGVPFSDGSKNILIGDKDNLTVLPCDYVKGEYCGAGDAFAGVLCGNLVCGRNIEESVAAARDFLKEVIAFTHAQGGTWEQGIAVEGFLNRLFIPDLSS